MFLYAFYSLRTLPRFLLNVTNMNNSLTLEALYIRTNGIVFNDFYATYFTIKASPVNNVALFNRNSGIGL